jgi:hypothetical protein
MKVLVILSTVFVAMGILPLPYGFYMLLRITICLTAVVGLVRAREERRPSWLWIYGVLSVLYNPVLPVHLMAKSLWIMINIATIALLWKGLMVIGNRVS